MTNTALTTSLAEIRSFKPCASGWRDILTARKPSCDEDYNIQFPLVDCLESNSIEDVCWLLDNRQKEIQICVRFARMCADSVKDLKSYWSNKAAVYAEAADYAAAYAAAAAAYAAATAAAYDDYDDYKKQKELNKQFLIQCVNEFNPE